MMKFVLAAIASLVPGTVAGASAPAVSHGSVHDPDRLLSRQTSETVEDAAAAFEKLTGRRLVVMVLPPDRGPDPESMVRPRSSSPGANIGIVYATTPDDPAGRLLIVDPVWRAALPAEWSHMYPQRLAQLYGDEPFERRIVLGAEYLATVLADKIAFVLKPRGGRLSEESLQFSRGAFIGIEILVYFIIFLTVFRTFWPARLRDEDQDEFSNEIRRLKKERQIW